MPIYVALLRGIAPSNPNMQNHKLRGVFEELGFSKISTVLSSGNVVFESPSRNAKKLEAVIEKALAQRLGISSTTIVRSKAQLQQLANKNPFNRLEHTKKTSLNVTFLKKKTGPAIKFPRQVGNGDAQILRRYGGAICSLYDSTSSRTSQFMLWLEKNFGKEITTRTWKTVERIRKAME